MGMLLRHRPGSNPNPTDEFYKKAEKAFREQQEKAIAPETKDVAKPQLKGRRRKTD